MSGVSVANAQPTTVPFEYYERLVFLYVKVNQADSLLFLFDTGANASAIHNKTADDLKLTLVKTDTVEGTAGNIIVPFVSPDSVAMGRYAKTNMVMTKYDLSGSLAPPGKRLDGILGTDFLADFVITLDFQKMQMTLSRELEHPLSNPIRFEMDNGIPRVQGRINNSQSTWFRYDSGSSLFDTKDIYLNVTASVLDSLLKRNPSLEPKFKLSASGIGGSVELPVYRVDSVSLQTISIFAPFLIAQPRQGYFARPDAVGFFGNNLLEKTQKATIDFPNRTMYIHHSDFSKTGEHRKHD